MTTQTKLHQLSNLFFEFENVTDDIILIEEKLKQLKEDRRLCLSNIETNESIADTLKTIGIVHNDIKYTLRSSRKEDDDIETYHLKYEQYEGPMQSYNIDEKLGGNDE